MLEGGHERANFAIVATGRMPPAPTTTRPTASSARRHRALRLRRDDGRLLLRHHPDVRGGRARAARLRDAYAVLWRHRKPACGPATVARACEDVDAATRRVIADAGYGEYFVHRTGHGIGTEAHEDPYVVAGNDTRWPGHAFSVEPGIYLPGRFGLRLEDIVVATDAGPERLNHAPRDLASSARGLVIVQLDLATLLAQWAPGGLFFCWVTTRRREVGIGYGWLLRVCFGAIACSRSWRAQARRRRRAPCATSAPRSWRSAAGIALLQSSCAGPRGCAVARDARAVRGAAAAGTATDDRRAPTTPRRFRAPDDRAEEFDPLLDLLAPLFGASRCSARRPCRRRLRAEPGPPPGGRALPRRGVRRHAPRPLVPGAARSRREPIRELVKWVAASLAVRAGRLPDPVGMVSCSPVRSTTATAASWAGCGWSLDHHHRPRGRHLVRAEGAVVLGGDGRDRSPLPGHSHRLRDGPAPAAPCSAEPSLRRGNPPVEVDEPVDGRRPREGPRPRPPAPRGRVATRRR